MNRPDLPSDDPVAAQQYTSALETYVSTLELDPTRIATLSPERASRRR